MDFSTRLLIFFSSFSGPMAYTTILGVLLACGLGVPIPEDITLIAAGVLAGLGKISLPGAYIAGFIGVLVGDAFLFFLGRKLGRRAFELPLIKKIMTPKRIQMAEKKIQANSKFVCFTARFLPGLRAPIFLTSGILGVRPITFIALDGFAALISVPFWVYVGWFFSKNLDQALEFAKQAQLYLVLGIATLIFIYFMYQRYKKKMGVSSPL
jgi:membrane protein DedA with SNARE-associated domain